MNKTAILLPTLQVRQVKVNVLPKDIQRVRHGDGAQILPLELHSVQGTCSCCPFLLWPLPWWKSWDFPIPALVGVSWGLGSQWLCLPLRTYPPFPELFSFPLFTERRMWFCQVDSNNTHFWQPSSPPSQKPSRKSKLAVFPPPPGWLCLKLKLGMFSFFNSQFIVREKKSSCPSD